MKKVFIFSFGCSNRYLDAEKYKLFFQKNNFLLADNLEEADYIILNTCAFRKSEEDIAIARLIEFQKRKKPDAEIIVTGCLPAINGARMRQYFSGQSVTPKEITKLDSLFGATTSIAAIPDSNTYRFHRPKKIREAIMALPRIGANGLLKKAIKYGAAKILQNKTADEKESFYYLRIVNGCLGNCSYCAIKYAIGNAKSKPLEEVLIEIKNILEQDKDAKIVLIGDDTGAYGLDIGTTFADLLKTVAQIDAVKQIDIEEINIHWLVKDYEAIAAVLRNPKFKNLQFALQSGSERILKLMNRPVLKSPREIAKLLGKLKEINPDLNFKGQFIIGFPGETVEDVNLTLENILESELDEVSLFKFDPKPNTPAEKMPDQIAEREKEARIRRIKNKLKNNRIKVFTNN